MALGQPGRFSWAACAVHYFETTNQIARYKIFRQERHVSFDLLFY